MFFVRSRTGKALKTIKSVQYKVTTGVTNYYLHSIRIITTARRIPAYNDYIITKSPGHSRYQPPG